jgi:hypothetical protein
VNVRSGTARIHNNIVSGFTTGAQFHLDVYRRFHPFAPWGQADGTSAWDVNLAGGPFASGTATGGGALTLTDSTKAWTPNQWVGYALKKVGCSGYCASEITGNTATTITVHDSGSYAANISFPAGTAYQIWKVQQTFDQPGRGMGTQLSGTNPTPVGNSQVTEPLYEWNNTREAGANVNFASAGATIRANEHFFNDTVAPGYTPYTYPHPMVSGTVSTNAPTPPSNLQITPN